MFSESYSSSFRFLIFLQIQYQLCKRLAGPLSWSCLEQPGDPSASLLLTSEKAVFCNTGVSKKVANRMRCIRKILNKIQCCEAKFSHGHDLNVLDLA